MNQMGQMMCQSLLGQIRVTPAVGWYLAAVCLVAGLALSAMRPMKLRVAAQGQGD